MNSLKHAIPTSSVNDEYFHLPRVRNAPIKSSMCCIDGLPKKLKIYRIAGSKYWQMRLYNLGKYTTQSLKTTDKEEAVAQARLIFESLKEAGEYVDRIPKTKEIPALQNQKILHDLIQEILAVELEKVQRDEIKHNSFVMTQIRLESLIFDFFKNYSLNKIDATVL